MLLPCQAGLPPLAFTDVYGCVWDGYRVRMANHSAASHTPREAADDDTCWSALHLPVCVPNVHLFRVSPGSDDVPHSDLLHFYVPQPKLGGPKAAVDAHRSATKSSRSRAGEANCATHANADACHPSFRYFLRFPTVCGMQHSRVSVQHLHTLGVAMVANRIRIAGVGINEISFGPKDRLRIQ